MNSIFIMILRSKLEICFLIVFVLYQTTFANDPTCQEPKFNCDDHRCIPRSWVCDGTPDCHDNTDESELNCPNRGIVENCRDDQFLCNSGICIPGSWKCDGGKDCPDGSDEETNLCQVNCTESEFTCDDKQCIDIKWKCNGLTDCEDGSDEENCDAPTTDSSGTPLDSNPDSYRCGDGFVIPNRWLCDGEKDCRDGSDENCDPEEMHISEPISSCKASEFLCPDSYCIPKAWVCDGMRECLNGEDEMDCPPRNCTSREYRCQDGTCVIFTYRCNGQQECPDGTDELNCETTTTTTTTTTTRTSPKTSTTTEAGTKDQEVTKEPCNPETHFLCRNGICISKEKLCDGRRDCSQMEDESTEQCGVNECARNNGACIQKCINTRNGYQCACNKGYRLIGKYNCEDIDECKEIPGVCSQECANTVGNFHCSCISGYMKDPANYTRCKAAHGEVFLLFSHTFDIRQLRLRDRDMTAVVEDTRSAIALDYVFSDRQILWSDNKENKIYRANLSNTNVRQVLGSHEEVSVDGLAVDWIHKNVYYTNKNKDAVQLLSWDGQWTKTIVIEDVGSPRAIAISPLTGYIIWTDWGTEAKIERASLDGSNRVAIVSNSQHVRWPNGLTIDHPTERIYWCDGYLGTIFAANNDGSNVEVILHSTTVLNHPFSISVFEDRIYWTDWSRVALFSADKFTGGEIVNVSAGHLLEAPRVVHVFHEYRQPQGENVCESSRCQHFCTMGADRKATCLCADGYVLDVDRTSCIVEVLTSTTIEPITEADTSVSSSIPTTPVINTIPTTRAINIIPTTPAYRSNYISKQQDIHEGVKIYKEGERTSQVGFILGGTFGAAVVIAAIVALYVVYVRTSRRSSKRIRFHNPVYKNTTIEDDERGYTIGQEELFSSSFVRMHPDSLLTDADDAPLAPKDDSEE